MEFFVKGVGLGEILRISMGIEESRHPFSGGQMDEGDGFILGGRRDIKKQIRGGVGRGWGDKDEAIWPLAVSMSTGMFRPRSRRARQSAKPSSPGIMTSSKIRSNVSVQASSRPVMPSSDERAR